MAKISLVELAKIFLKIGILSFGGPYAHISLFEDELINNKKLISKNKLLTTICYRLNNKTTFAIEGSIFVAGAGVQWLRDKIKLINNDTQ